MVPFSWQTRIEALQKLDGAHFDLIVIGGGITGAGVARDAAMRGLKCLLLEKNDFASGTSSKSSKLVHGGLRYLKQLEFALTRESCMERNLLTRENPHLVRPIPFVFPVYRTDKDGMLAVRAGMWLYEILSGFQNHERHRMLSPRETLEQIPGLNAEGLKGSAYYFDAAVDDVRLTLETLKSAVRRGALVLNHAPVTGFLHDPTGRVVGLRFADSITGGTYSASGTVLLNATGVWVDSVRGMEAAHAPELRPSKGIHLVVPSARLRQNATLAFGSRLDGRLMFSIPWGDVTLIGTTDTFYDGDPDELHSDTTDVDYVLRAANHTFPNAKLSEADVISSFAGVRPLIAPPGEAQNASAVSREHHIFEDPSGLLSIAGGKLTTYRLMAEALVDKAVERLPMERRRVVGPCQTERPLTDTKVDVAATVRALVRAGQPDSVAEHLVAAYGSQAEEVLQLCHHVENGAALLQQGHGFLRGEVVFAVRYESALHLTDLLTRRLRFAVWVPGQGEGIAEDVSRLMAAELGWTEAIRLEELDQFREELRRSYRPWHGGS